MGTLEVPVKFVIPHFAKEATLPFLFFFVYVVPPSEERLLSPTLPASPINNRYEVRAAAQTGEHGGRQVDLVQTGVRVLFQVAVGVALRLVDHDSDRRKVEQRGGHVVRQVGGQPALPSQQRHQVLLVQEGEEEEGEREEPEQHRHEQDEVDGALVFVGSDGDPQPGSEDDLQDPGDSPKAADGLQDVLPHLGLGRLGGHLSPTSRSLLSPKVGRVV